MFDINHVSDDAELDHLLGRTITPVGQVQMNLYNPEGFTAKWGKKITAAGGRYSECRGYNNTRFIYLPWTPAGRSLCDAICSAHPSKRMTLIVHTLYNNFRGSHIHAPVVVHCIDTTACKSASEALWGRYCDAFTKAFPAVKDNRPLAGREGTVAFYVPEGVGIDSAPRAVKVGRVESSGYEYKVSDGPFSTLDIQAERLFDTKAEAWAEISRLLTKQAEQFRLAADVAAEAAAAGTEVA